MKTPSISSLSAILFLSFFVSPLRSEPQEIYWSNYPVHGPLDSRLHTAEEFSEQLAVSSGQNPNLPFHQSRNFDKNNLNHPVRKPGTSYQQKGGYYDYQTSVSRSEENKENAKRNEDDVTLSQSSESTSKEKEILKNMNILDKWLSEDSSEVDNNLLGEKIMSEETKRVARAIRKQRPGFFWTLVKVTFETFNDTRSAFQQISDIINDNISPDSATQSSVPSGSLTVAGSTNSPRNTSSTNETESTTAQPTTTTEAPFVLTRTGLQSLIRRNVLGLVKLFNLEWSDALNQSEVSVKEFQKKLNQQVGSFLQDNPNAY